MRKISFRITPQTKAAAEQMAAARGLTFAGLIREYLRDYLTAVPPAARTMPNRRGALPVTVFVGTELGRAARARATENQEDLSRPIVERLTADIERWSTPQNPENP